MSGAGVQFRSWVRRAAIRVIRRAPVQPIKQWNIVRGDLVQILAGRSAGKTGKVKTVLRRKNRIIVEGLNLVKRHVRATPGTPGGVLSMESPLHISNVNLVDPTTGKPTRIAIKYTAEGVRVRIAKRSGTMVPAPQESKERKRLRATEPGPKDTPAATVRKQTYFPTPELAQYLARGGPLYRIRTDASEMVPRPLREGFVKRRKDRNRMRGNWERKLEGGRLGAAVAAVRAGGGSASSAEGAALSTLA